jgi:hypothetical protein
VGAEENVIRGSSRHNYVFMAIFVNLQIRPIKITMRMIAVVLLHNQRLAVKMLRADDGVQRPFPVEMARTDRPIMQTNIYRSLLLVKLPCLVEFVLCGLDVHFELDRLCVADVLQAAVKGVLVHGELVIGGIAQSLLRMQKLRQMAVNENRTQWHIPCAEISEAE